MFDIEVQYQDEKKRKYFLQINSMFRVFFLYKKKIDV